MEPKKLSKEMEAALRAPLPPEAISPHPTKTFMSSIKAIYVAERLNQVFGIGQWRLQSTVQEATAAMVVVQSVLSIPEYGILLEAYGGNDNKDKGDAYKGAATDSLTKIGSYLEIGIDVFKGLKTAPTNGAKVMTDKPLPELKYGSEEYGKALKAIRDGKATLSDVKKKRTVSDVTETRLMREASMELVNN